MIGDFNEVLNIEDRRGQTRVTNSMRKFRDFINTHHFRHVELFVKKFTWGRGVSRSKIDCVLCHASWITNIPRLKLLGGMGLQKSFSNHNPLCLQLDPCDFFRPRPFSSMIVWLNDSMFKPMIEGEWRSLGGIS